jgi:MYND finger/RING-type zinc-finger
MTSKPRFDVKTFRQFIACDSCGKENPSKRCSKCRCTFYCSVECQKEHWSKHKAGCRPILILGKQMNGAPNVADEELEQLESVNSCCSICLEEPIVNPIILKDCRHSFCLKCLMEWQKYQKNDDISVKKSSCPICRKAIAKTVSEEALEKAMQYGAAGQFAENYYEPSLGSDDFAIVPKRFPLFVDEKQQKCYDLAMNQIQQVLIHDPTDLAALCLKGQMFRFVHPGEAIEAFEMLSEIDRKACENVDKLRAIRSHFQDPQYPTEEEQEQYISAHEEIAASGKGNLYQLGSGLFRLYEIKIWSAEAYESACKYDTAAYIYKGLLGEIYSFENSIFAQIDPRLIRMTLSGASRCCFALKDFERAKSLSKIALGMNRHFPGIHMLVAQAQWALGEHDDAVITMKRGILYETPWDVEYQERNIAFLERMLSALGAEE